MGPHESARRRRAATPRFEPVISLPISREHVGLIRTVHWIWLCLGLSAFPAVWAHRPSDSWIQFNASDRHVTLRLDLALKDLDAVLGLDANDDGTLTWGELRRRESDLMQYVTQRLTLTNSDERMTWVPEPLRLVQHEEVVCASFNLNSISTKELRQLTLIYRCLFELDPQHRALVQADWANPATEGRSNGHFTGILSPAEPGMTLQVGPDACRSPNQPSPAPAPNHAFAQFFREGVHHIWTGYDHLLFLAALLLPSVVTRRRAIWEPAPAFRPVVVAVLQVVTSFTAAHSLTLALAAFGMARPPSRIIESAIAASVLYAALRNLRPGQRPGDIPVRHPNAPPSVWLGWRESPATIPFSFGLIHGFGFANALGELGLSGTGLAVPLIAFNLGVETGQLACVAVFLPVAYGLRATPFYRRGILPGGSLLIAAVAAAWLIDRSFNCGFMPF